MAKSKGNLISIEPNKILINPENPRLHFPEREAEKLRASLDQQGVLVPVSVYEHSRKAGRYVLVDGERRWREAKKLGIDKIPAIVGDRPDPIGNIQRMFHIHMVRERWQDIPTARALKLLMERSGESDPAKLSKMTGLGKEQIARYNIILDLPKRYQDYIETRKIPMNWFVELHQNVIVPLAESRPNIFSSLGEKTILRSFVKKRLDNVMHDPVDFRRVSKIIEAAERSAGSPQGKSDMDKTLVSLVTDPRMTVDDAYRLTVEMDIEAGEFEQECHQLVHIYDKLIAKSKSSMERDRLNKAIASLESQLLKRLSPSRVVSIKQK